MGGRVNAVFDGEDNFRGVLWVLGEVARLEGHGVVA